MTWLRALVVLLFLATSCAPRAETPLTVAATLAIQQLQLDNGLLVVLDPDPTAPSAFVDVRYHVGFKDDPVGRAGLAHLVEHLTFAPTQGAGDLDRMATLEHFGAVDVNGTTSFDVTDYYATVPPPLLAQALWVEASRMARPLAGIDENALRRERAVVKNELRASHGRHAYGLATLLIAAALYGKDHPYGRIANHTRSEVDRATLDEVQAFAIRHYRPANATLVVSGRFDVEAVRALVARSFGPLPSGPAPAREVLPAARLSKDDVATFGAPVRAKELAVGWLVPPPEKDGFDEMALAARVIQRELRTKLTVELHLLDEVKVTLGAAHLGSMLVVAAKLRGDATPERALSEIDRVMSFVASLGRTFEWDQFSQTRLELATSFSAAFEQPASRAEELLYELEYAGAIRSTAAEAVRIQRLRAADVGGATQRFVSDAHRAVVILVPDPTAPPSGARR